MRCPVFAVGSAWRCPTAAPKGCPTWTLHGAVEFGDAIRDYSFLPLVAPASAPLQSRLRHMTTRKMVLIVAALAMAACRSQSQPKVESQPAAVGWRPVESFSGRGSAQTQSFEIESGQWRIKWETKNEMPAGTGTFQVTVHSAVSGRPLALAVDHHGVGHDIAYVNEDPRLFHLVIDSSNVDWSVAIEEAVASR